MQIFIWLLKAYCAKIRDSKRSQSDSIMFTTFHLFSESEILCYLQATKLTKNSSIAAARRHETPGSEIQDFITQDSNRHLLPVPWAPVPYWEKMWGWGVGWRWSRKAVGRLRQGCGWPVWWWDPQVRGLCLWFEDRDWDWMWSERKRRALDGAEGFDLSNWKNGVAMNKSGKECSLSRFRAGMGRKKKCRFSFWKCLSLRYP